MSLLLLHCIHTSCVKNKHGYHTVNISHTGIMLHGHIETFLHISTKIQLNAISTSFVIAMHIPEANMP